MKPYRGQQPKECALLVSCMIASQRSTSRSAGILPGMRESLIRNYLARGFRDILTMSPCDLWPLIVGRTLWFSGDSQTQVRAGPRYCLHHLRSRPLLYCKWSLCKAKQLLYLTVMAGVGSSATVLLKIGFLYTDW